jgi:hypothetical protein
VLAESLLLLVFLLVGYAVQLAGAPARPRDVVWILFFWTFSPVLVSSRSSPSTWTRASAALSERRSSRAGSSGSAATATHGSSPARATSAER